MAKRLSVRLKKSREGEKPRPDGTRGSIEYFMLKPKAKAPHYLQPGKIVGVKLDTKWVQFKLIEGKGSPTRNYPSNEKLTAQTA